MKNRKLIIFVVFTLTLFVCLFSNQIFKKEEIYIRLGNNKGYSFGYFDAEKKPLKFFDGEKVKQINFSYNDNPHGPWWKIDIETSKIKVKNTSLSIYDNVIIFSLDFIAENSRKKKFHDYKLYLFEQRDNKTYIFPAKHISFVVQ